MADRNLERDGPKGEKAWTVRVSTCHSYHLDSMQIYAVLQQSLVLGWGVISCGMMWYDVIISLISHIYRPFQMNEFLTCSFALDLTSTEVESATLTATWALDFGGHFRIYM